MLFDLAGLLSAVGLQLGRGRPSQRRGKRCLPRQQGVFPAHGVGACGRCSTTCRYRRMALVPVGDAPPAAASDAAAAAADGVIATVAVPVEAMSREVAATATAATAMGEVEERPVVAEVIPAPGGVLAAEVPSVEAPPPAAGTSEPAPIPKGAEDVDGSRRDPPGVSAAVHRSAPSGVGGLHRADAPDGGPVSPLARRRPSWPVVAGWGRCQLHRRKLRAALRFCVCPLFFLFMTSLFLELQSHVERTLQKSEFMIHRQKEARPRAGRVPFPAFAAPHIRGPQAHKQKLQTAKW
jgi:hypothetical protein